MSRPKATFSKFRSRWWAFCEIDRQARRGRGCTGTSLARDLEVDARTIRRYISFMREELDAPIVYDPVDKTYTLSDPTWSIPNVSMNVTELLALAISARSMASVVPEPLSAALETLLAKLLDALPDARRVEINSISSQVDFVSAPIASKGQQWVMPLLEALIASRIVEVSYQPLGESDAKLRRIEPYHLRFFAGTWYVIAQDSLTGHMPVFNLARIQRLEVTDETFEPRQFSAESYFASSIGVTVGGTPRHVRLRISGHAARTAGEHIWPAGFTVAEEPDGSVLLEGTITGVEELLASIAAIGGDVTILP